MANPSSSTTSTLGLSLFYEGVKVDNDTFNDNFTKIDNALKGVMMFEKLVGTTTISLGGNNSAVTTNYATTNFDFMVIKVFGSTAADAYASQKGAGMIGNIPEIRIPKPTANTNYLLPRYYQSEADGDISYGTFTLSTTGITVPAVSSGAQYRYNGAMVIEFYKYATS